MYNAERIRRDKVYDSIKCMYEEKILTYDMTPENLLLYIRTYLNIVIMLESVEASRSAIKYRLGDEFEKWFFETHDKIIEGFWCGYL